MRKLVILGAGTAGTMAATKLRPQLPRDEWSVTIVDQNETHYYQPGYLFIPFGIYRPDEVTKPIKRFIPSGVDLVTGAIDRVVADENKVLLDDGRELPYDYLIIATGTTPRPDETPGMADDLGGSVHEFYTYKGATALADKLRTWEGGHLVVHITEMPIKCPVAPLEFTFLADAFFTEQGIRDNVKITYVTPLEGAFTKPVASKYLGDMLDKRNVHLEPDFMIESIDTEAKKLVSFDEREVDYDLLVTIPLNMGADYIARSDLGDDLNYVPVDQQTLLSKKHDNIFAVGDASDIPASKAGSVAHFAMDLFPANFMNHIQGLTDDGVLRRPRQLLHRDRARQGPAHRLQLRDRAAAGQVPTAGCGAVLAAEGDGVEPLGQGDVPLDVLEHPAARQGTAAARAHVDGGQGDRRPAMTAEPTTVELAERIDRMSEQMDFIAAEMLAQRRARETWTELSETLVPVTRGAMDVATRELDDLSDDVTADDLVRFARTAARSLPKLEAMMAQLDSLSELMHTVNSLRGAGLAKVTDVLAAADDKGYFVFAREGSRIADRVVTEFTEEDVQALGDNVVTILNAVKEMTQPEVMGLVQRTAG